MNDITIASEDAINISITYEDVVEDTTMFENVANENVLAKDVPDTTTIEPVVETTTTTTTAPVSKNTNEYTTNVPTHSEHATIIHGLLTPASTPKRKRRRRRCHRSFNVYRDPFTASAPKAPQAISFSPTALREKLFEDINKMPLPRRSDEFFAFDSEDANWENKENYPPW